MHKVKSFLLIAILYMSIFASNLSGQSGYNDCGFLHSEMKRYEWKIQHARDKYEYQMYIRILDNYRRNFFTYCMGAQGGSQNQPFRNQQDQSGGYLGY